jgi:hypothetical protein
MNAKRKADDSEQSRAFIEAARELGCEGNLGRLDEMIRRVAKLPTRAAAMPASEPEAAPEKRRREEAAEPGRAVSSKETEISRGKRRLGGGSGAGSEREG